MTRSESQALVRFHSARLEGLGFELNQALANDDWKRAAEMLPSVNNEVQIVAGHVSKLLASRVVAVNKRRLFRK